MQNSKKFLSIPIAIALVLSGCAHEQKQVTKTVSPVAVKEVVKPVEANPPATAVAKPIIEQHALDRLKQMSDKLTAAKAFSYHANSLIEVQSETGQFITSFTDSEVTLQRPNKYRSTVSGDVPTIELYFDDNKLSALDVEKNLYAESSKPIASIDEMLALLITKIKMNFPSADITNSNPYGVMTKNLTDAIVLGDSMVNGVLCEHFAYREPAIDWEIWIEKGDNALPRRLAMTYKQAEKTPSFLDEYADWNLNPKLKASTFEFKAPKDAKQIKFGTDHE